MSAETSEEESNHKEPKFFSPFRFLQYLLRFAQREDSKQTGRRNYNSLTDRDLVRALKSADRPWQRFRKYFNVDRAMAWITFGLLLTSYWQWSAVREQGEYLKQQSQLLRNDQRPWLSVRPLFKPPVAGSRLDIKFPVRNTGKTPGHLFGMRAAAFFLPPSEDVRPYAEMELERLNMIEVVVPPSPEDCVDGVDEMLPVVTLEHIAGMQKGETVLFLVGRLAYYDLADPNADPPPQTEFCYIYRADLGQWMQFNQYNIMR